MNTKEKDHNGVRKAWSMPELEVLDGKKTYGGTDVQPGEIFDDDPERPS